MIDRPSRTQLVAAINRYINHQSTAFAFDKEIHQIRDATDDPTVHFVANTLWFHYDDCKDHHAGLSKEEWDYLQRLILLLESSGQIDGLSQRRWSLRQVLAAAAFCGFGLCVVRLGVGWHLFGVALFFGPISISLASWRERAEQKQAKNRSCLFPFASLADVRAAYRSAAGFAKEPYPPQLQERRVHSRLFTAAVSLQTYILWSLVSPLVLFFQMLPERQTEIRIQQTPLN